jgi:phosphoesterase RecJ-like protein
MSRYSIPLRDSLVVGHANPDGDSLSSVKAVINYLRLMGRMAVARISGKVPEHLSWILPEDDLPKELPRTEQTIVLDCGPDRIGFDTGDGPIVNIDHHLTRAEQHDPKSRIYVLDRCSTAAALILDFGIVDDILLVGLYTDTLFVRSWGELQQCFRKISVSDERAHALLTACRPTRDRRALAALQNAEIHRCRNGFLIAELKEEKDPAVVTEVMETLFRYAEGVCLIASDGMARFRTSNEKIDVGSLAKLFGGGGHAFASGCDATGKKTAIMSVIKQLEVPLSVPETDAEPSKNGKNGDKKEKAE